MLAATAVQQSQRVANSMTVSESETLTRTTSIPTGRQWC